MSTQNSVLGLLMALAGINFLWLVLSRYGEPDTFIFLYILAAYAYFREHSFLPVFVMAIMGLMLHGYYFAAETTSALTSLDRAFFVANMLLPLSLLFVAGKAMWRHLNANR